VWHAPLGVHSVKRRHQSPEWTILSHSYCLIQGEIVRPQVLLDSLHPCSTRTSWWSPPVLQRGSSYDTPGICLIWHSCNMAEQRNNKHLALLNIMCKTWQVRMPHTSRIDKDKLTSHEHLLFLFLVEVVRDQRRVYTFERRLRACTATSRHSTLLTLSGR